MHTENVRGQNPGQAVTRRRVSPQPAARTAIGGSTGSRTSGAVQQTASPEESAECVCGEAVKEDPAECAAARRYHVHHGPCPKRPGEQMTR